MKTSTTHKILDWTFVVVLFLIIYAALKLGL